MEQRGHLVDERARAAGAVAVHAVFVAAGQIGNLRVFAAQLDNDVRLGVIGADGLRAGDDFLNEGDAQVVCQGDAAGACNGNGDLLVTENLIGILQQIPHLLANVRVMADIARVQALLGVVEDGDLYRRRTNVNAYM